MLDNGICGVGLDSDSSRECFDTQELDFDLCSVGVDEFGPW